MAVADSPLILELRELVQRIALKSQVSAAPRGRATPSTDDEIGGKRPPGGINGADDWSLEADGYWMKSADYFQRRLDRILRRPESQQDKLLTELIVEAAETLKRWQRSPLDVKRPESMADAKFEIFVAYSEEHAGTLARWYGCTPENIRRIRRKFRDAR